MANRTTVKSNIQNLNVPSVTNEDMEDMLNDNICDNVVFQEDVVKAQNTSVSSVNVNFTGYDRVNLSGYGLNLTISVSGLDDGNFRWLKVIKTSGRTISFSGVTLLNYLSENLTSATEVDFIVIRKGSKYYALPLLEQLQRATETKEGVLQVATQAQANALVTDLKIVTPKKIPIATTSQKGIQELSTNAESISGSADDKLVTPASMHAKLNNFKTLNSWTSISLQPGWTGIIEYFIDPFGLVHMRFGGVRPTSDLDVKDTQYTITDGFPYSNTLYPRKAIRIPWLQDQVDDLDSFGFGNAPVLGWISINVAANTELVGLFINEIGVDVSNIIANFAEFSHYQIYRPYALG